MRVRATRGGARALDEEGYFVRCMEVVSGTQYSRHSMGCNLDCVGMKRAKRDICKVTSMDRNRRLERLRRHFVLGHCIGYSCPMLGVLEAGQNGHSLRPICGKYLAKYQNNNLQAKAPSYQTIVRHVRQLTFHSGRFLHQDLSHHHWMISGTVLYESAPSVILVVNVGVVKKSTFSIGISTILRGDTQETILGF
jgi:hypothetical protein